MRRLTIDNGMRLNAACSNAVCALLAVGVAASVETTGGLLVMAIATVYHAAMFIKWFRLKPPKQGEQKPSSREPKPPRRAS